MMKIRHCVLAFWGALAVIAAGLGVGPASGGVGDIRIENAWVRESPIGATSGGGYMRIVNTGREPDRLLRVESAIAKSVVLKEMYYVGDASQTRELANGIEIPAGGIVYLRLESYYLLFMDLKAPFKVGQQYDAALIFEKAGRVPVQFNVQPRIYWW